MPKRKKCSACNGEGKNYVCNGPDDCSFEMCEECLGQGQIDIGFYPDAPHNNRNCWTNDKRCFNCRYKFNDIEDLFNTGCPKCHRSFVS